jgi:hypothetical protein
MAGKMRDLQIARLTIYPVQYNRVTNTLKVHHHINLIANHPGGEILPLSSSMSEAFKPIYDAFLTNSSVIDPAAVTRGQYWFVVPDNLVSNISPIVDWEKAKGFLTKIFPLSSIGFNPSSTTIYNYIKAQYFAASIKPDYVCLIGDTQISGGSTMPTKTFYTPLSPGEIDSDNYYSFLDGDDYFPDVFIGRISVNTSLELTNYISKYFGYERNPYVDDTTWYHRATVISGGEDNWFVSPRQTKMWTREIMLDHGYTNVDTIFSTVYEDPPPSEITASISAGVSLVNFRGYGYAEGWYSHYLWYTTYNLAQLTNGPKYGIMHSMVCATGDYNDNYVPNCFGETWIRLNNKGGPGFIGNTNHYAHTKWTNSIDCGIYWGLFQTGVHTLAQSLLAGKMNLYLSFPEYTAPEDEVDLYFNSYNVLGNPELNYWLAVPKAMAVGVPDTLGVGRPGLDIAVTDMQGNPIENAYVCLWKGAQIFTGQFVAEDGFARFQIEADSAGPLRVTITAPSYISFEGIIQIVDFPQSIGLSNFSINDDSIGASRGNSNGQANPGEIIEINSVLKNYGNSQTANSVEAQINPIDPYISIQTAQANFGDIASGDSAVSIQPFVVQIAADAPDNCGDRLSMDINAAGGGPWYSILIVPINAPDLNVTSVAVDNDNNGNHQLDRGESAQLIISLMNQGSQSFSNSQAILRSSDSLVAITDSLGEYPDIQIDSTVGNVWNPFGITISPDIYDGHRINCELALTSVTGVVRTIPFVISVGVVGADDPLGPDAYGYYCFDNTDLGYLQRPTYSWVPIETSWPYVNIPDDDEAIINLPFSVTFYGQLYNQITISDNGYIALGQTWWSNFQNAQIPGPQCAKAMIAGYWDDIISGGGGSIRVSYRYDQLNGRFIIGWKNVYVKDTYQMLTFEIIILDETVWPTRTNDNDIIIQYNLVNSCTTNTVGICNFDRTDGLQYMFNNIVDQAAAPLISGRAIKYSTGSLDATAVDDQSDITPNSYLLNSNYPNPFNSSTIIEFELPVAAKVAIDIYDIVGRRIKTLVNDQMPSGRHFIRWDGTGEDGETVASGVYFYRLRTGNTDLTKRMSLIK